MAVRSRRFFGPTTLGTSSGILYTCPAGRTAIIRTLFMYNRSGGSAVALVGINGSGSADVIALRNMATQTSAVVAEEIILNPGDVLRAHATAATAVAVTGVGSLLYGEPE